MDTLEPKPNYLLFIHWQDQRAWFTVISDMYIQQAKKFYEYHLLISGKSGNVWCFFDDYDLKDEDLINIATKFMKGQYKEINVDLKTFDVTEKEGVDLTHPR